ncbi:OmpA family protein (plasmid) [Azospirillum sp. TSA2s]|nr:OmpA family protein [Azospirillum sp. TSA2s]
MFLIYPKNLLKESDQTSDHREAPVNEFRPVLRRVGSAAMLSTLISVGGLTSSMAQGTVNFVGRTPTDCEIAKAIVGVAGPECAGPSDGTRSLQLGSVAQPEAPPPPPTPQAPRITAFAIAFEYDSARLRPEAHGLLDSISRVLKSNEAGLSRFVIEGHTDSRGNSSYNQKLSERRAQSVAEYLITVRGVAPDRLTWVGRGKTQPLNPADPAAPENRRVTIVNIGS